MELASDWSATRFGATLSKITIVTPYGQVSAQPKFNYAANLLPIDTPFSYPKGGQVEFHYPQATKVATPIIDDTYGRSGIPFILNVVTHLPQPPPGEPIGSGLIQISPPGTDSRPSGWSSQLGFGGRDGAYDAQVWKGTGGATPPFRPDFDFGEARSQLEAMPAANFVAQAPIRFEPPNPLSLLPGAVQSIVSGVELWVEVNPRFAADYAAQFGLLSREGTISLGCAPFSGEFPASCGVAESSVGLQANAQGRIDITGSVHLKISFVDLGFFSPDDIDVTESFTIPLPSPARVWDPPKIASAPSAHDSSRVGWAIHAATKPDTSIWQGVKGLSGASASNVRQWTEACLATPPKNPTPPPPPSYEPGNANDLTPRLLPCNICVADSKQNKYDPFQLFKVSSRKPGLPPSVCEWEQNAGCYDMCSWNGASWIRVEQAAVDVVDTRCGLHRPPVIK